MAPILSFLQKINPPSDFHIIVQGCFFSNFTIIIDLPLKTMADVAPITPKKGEYMGLCSAVAILNLCVLSEKMGQVIIRLR